MARCLVGCGANVGSPREQLGRAVELLGYMPGVSILEVSRLRETRPVGGPPGQPPYVNGACLVETEHAPAEFFGLLQSVENALHRERNGHWGPRTIDLDLLLYDDLVLRTDSLTIPHPRMATRRFVLEPAAEIAGSLVHPAAGCTVAELLDNISHPAPYIAIAAVPAAGAPEVALAVADRLFARVSHAPCPPPIGKAADPGRLEAVLAGWLGSLAAARGCGISHGVVSDFWTGSLRLAAESLEPAGRQAFDAVLGAALGAGVDEPLRPQVVLLLTADRAALGERIRFREGRSSRHSDVFADLVLPDDAWDAGVSSEDRLDELIGLQERLCRELCDGDASRRLPRPRDIPRAVVAIDSSDLGRAVEEAVAAVEAMA